MRTSILQKLVVVFLALFGTLNAAIDIANFEEADEITFAQVHGAGIDTVANPFTDGANSSTTCLQLTRSDRYNSQITFEYFESPINLYDATTIAFKVMTTNATEKTIKVILKDMTGYTVSLSDEKTPETANEWGEYTYDFEDLIKDSPISFITSIQFQINYGEKVDSSKAFEDIYIDEIRNNGFETYLTEEDTIAYYLENINKNFHAVYQGSIGNLWVYNENSFIMRGGMQHYDVADSIRVKVDWNGNLKGRDKFHLALEPAEVDPNFSYLLIKQACAGLDDLSFSWKGGWFGTPTSGLPGAIPTVEMSYNRTDWTELVSDDEISEAYVYNLIKYDIGTPLADADTIFVRLTNNEDVRLCADQFSITATSIFSEDIEIDGPDEIVSDSGQIQLTSTVYPAEANQATYWYISEGSDSATIDHSTGLVTAKGTGYIEVTAIAIDKIGATMTTHDIMIVAGASSIAVGDYEMDVQLYPNPVQDDLFIETPAALSSLSIFSLSGQLVRTVTNGFDKIDVSDLNGGMYFVQMTLGNQVHTQKIIKK